MVLSTNLRDREFDSYIESDHNGTSKKVFVTGGNENCPLTVIDYGHENIHEGRTFMYHDVIQLNSGIAQDYLIALPPIDGHYSHWGYSVEGTGVVTFELFEATDKTGTTAQANYNRNRTSSVVSTMTIFKGTSGGTTDGTKIATHKTGISTAGNRIATSQGSVSELILKPATKYIMRITSGTASQDITVTMDWYETGVC